MVTPISKGPAAKRALLTTAWLVACRGAPVEPLPPQPPPADGSALRVSAPAPIAVPATLGVHDMVGHPARWHGESVILFARLRHTAAPCDEGHPPSCPRPWILIDTNDAKPLTVALDPNGLELPLVCRSNEVERDSPSRCTNETLDPDPHYRLEGRLAYERGDTRFIATDIELAPPA